MQTSTDQYFVVQTSQFSTQAPETQNPALVFWSNWAADWVTESLHYSLDVLIINYSNHSDSLSSVTLQYSSAATGCMGEICDIQVQSNLGLESPLQYFDNGSYYPGGTDGHLDPDQAWQRAEPG